MSSAAEGVITFAATCVANNRSVSKKAVFESLWHSLLSAVWVDFATRLNIILINYHEVFIRIYCDLYLITNQL